MNDEFNIMQRQKMATHMNITEENAADIMNTAMMAQKDSVIKVLKYLGMKTDYMANGLKACGAPVHVCKALSGGMAMSVALTIIETIARDNNEVGKLAKELMAVVDKSKSVMMKVGEDDV